MITAEPQTRNADDLRRSAQMAAAQAGDRGAYEALLRDCVPIIKAVAGGQGVPPDRRDDVVQDVLLTIHRARQTYDPARSFTAWLRVIAERRAIDLLRQLRRHGAREFHAPLAFEAYADESADPARGIEQTEASGRVSEALAMLPPRQREAVELLVLKEQSLAEGAATTRSTKGALKVNLHRALKPVRRLSPPALRAALWLGAVAVIALGFVIFADAHAMWERITGAPDMWLAVLGSTATAVLAAIAAFELSLPDAPRGWAWLPLPGALLWLAASGFGCLRVWFLPQTHVAELGEARDCLIFIVSLSVPLSAMLFLMLRRACPLQPGLTAAIGGLAVAAAAATLLNFFHPYDAAATDLSVHAVAVALVVAANRALGGRIFAAPIFSRAM